MSSRFWFPVVALLVFGACHPQVEEVPLADDRMTSRDRFFDVFTLDGRSVVVVGYGGKILRSEDGGVSWEQVPSGTGLALMRVAFADSSRGWIVGQNGIVLRTEDGGRSWSRQETDAESHLFGLAVLTRDRVFACGDRSGWIATSDGGLSWQGGRVPLSDVGMDPDIAMAVQEPIYYDVFFHDEQTGWMVGDYGNIRHTTDGGKTWGAQHGSLLGQRMTGFLRPLRDSLDLPALFRVRMADRNRGHAVGVGGVVLETEDGGERWTILEPRVSPRLEAPLLEIEYVGERTLVLGGSATKVIHDEAGWRREDLGVPVLTWFAATAIAREGDLAGRRGFAVGGRGMVLKTDDAGRTWSPARRL